MKAFAITVLSLVLAAGSATVAASNYAPSAWEKQIVAACLVLEAADQGELGMRGVASVILNRANGQHARLMRVVKRPYAFTSLNAATNGRTGARGYADHVQKASRDRLWKSALKIVDDLYSRGWQDITYGANHYARKDIKPAWTRSMDITTIIGSHAFYVSYQ